MPDKTIYVVQSFRAGKRGRLERDSAEQFKTEADAVRKAERVSLRKLGVMVYSVTIDPDTGDTGDEPVIVFRAGQVPIED